MNNNDKERIGGYWVKLEENLRRKGAVEKRKSKNLEYFNECVRKVNSFAGNIWTTIERKEWWILNWVRG